MRRPSHLAVLPALFAALILSSCAPEEPALPEEPEYDVLYYAPLLRGNTSALDDTLEVVIRDEETWDQYKEQLRYFEEPREVDFSQAMLVLLALPVDTGGYQLAIDNVEHGDGKVMVTYIVYEPGGDCLNVTADITPYVVAEVRRIDDPVTFNRIREYVFCNTNL